MRQLRGDGHIAARSHEITITARIYFLDEPPCQTRHFHAHYHTPLPFCAKVLILLSSPRQRPRCPREPAAPSFHLRRFPASCATLRQHSASVAEFDSLGSPSRPAAKIFTASITRAPHAHIGQPYQARLRHYPSRFQNDAHRHQITLFLMFLFILYRRDHRVDLFLLASTGHFTAHSGRGHYSASPRQLSSAFHMIFCAAFSFERR